MIGKKLPSKASIFLKDNQPGSIGGEGSIAFVIDNNKTEKSYAALDAQTTFYRPNSEDAIVTKIDEFLASYNLSRSDIDVVVSGNNGNPEHDAPLNTVLKGFSDAVHAGFKNLCGQFDTSTAFGMWMAVKILKEQHIPDVVKLNDASRAINRVLLINHNNNQNYALQLFSKC